MILQNAIQNLETGEIIKSTHVHDFVVTSFKDNSYIAADGGTEYLRRVGNLKQKDVKWRELSLSDDYGFEAIKNMLVWGSRGKTSREKLKYLLIKELELGHLKDIIYTQAQIKGTIYEKVIKYWIQEKS